MSLSLAELSQAWLNDPSGTKSRWGGAVLVQHTTGAADSSWAPTRAAVVMSQPGTNEARVHLIAKTEGKPNAFPMGVTVGRVGSNDVELDDGSVSRFHAWLQRDERSGVWSLTDAESKNGTWVAGLELSPRQKVPLTDYTEIRLGNVYLTFLLPASLWAILAEKK